MSEQVIQNLMQTAEQASKVREQYFSLQGEMLTLVGRTAAVSLARGGKILFMGCGEDAFLCKAAAHVFINGIDLNRPPLPALAFTGESQFSSSDAPQDGGYAAQLKALGSSGDVLVVVSSNGGSRLLNAMKEAKRKEMTVVGLFNESAGDGAHFCDYHMIVPTKDAALASEIHLSVIHAICKVVDYYLFEAVVELGPYLNDPV